MKKHKIEPHLEIYHDRSVLVFEDGHEEVFIEGPPDKSTQQLLQHVKQKLESGWLEDIYRNLPKDMESLQINDNDQDKALLRAIVDSVTSEVGRAVAGITILQLTVKSIEPRLNIRLHKGGPKGFSWEKGFSMRSLDAQFITPFLRKYNLINLNKYGIFMTRSLAENYPYSQFYKASIRGAKSAWLCLIDKIEAKEIDPEASLKYLLALLRNRSERFRQIARQAIDKTYEFLTRHPDYTTILQLILMHVNSSSYSARLLEVCMHAFLQVLEDQAKLPGRLLPLCQMRTANKKHRNVADIEIVSNDDPDSVLEAWDAKYGKPYLRDELDELWEKLRGKSVLRAGFVVEREPDRRDEIKNYLQEIADDVDTEVYLFSLEEWMNFYLNELDMQIKRDQIARDWVKAYIESLCQERRDRAPIDEPADQWVEDWIKILDQDNTL